MMTGPSISERFRHSGVVPWLALAVGVGFVVSAGALYGRYSQRWGPPTELAAAGSHLVSMPREIGPWHMVEELPIGISALQQLECAGYVNRRYVSEQSGQTVAVTITVGPPGPTAVHTPEICFSSRAYAVQNARRAVNVEAANGEAHTLWSVDFKTRNLMADQLRTYYAWSRGQRWEASNSPRYEYAAAPLLYKIQLAGSIEQRVKSNDRDPCRKFMEDFVNTTWTLTER